MNNMKIKIIKHTKELLDFYDKVESTKITYELVFDVELNQLPHSITLTENEMIELREKLNKIK